MQVRERATTQDQHKHDGPPNGFHFVRLLRSGHDNPEIADVSVVHGRLDRPGLSGWFRPTRVASRSAVDIDPECVGEAEAEGADAATEFGIGPQRVRTGWDIAKGE